MSEYLISMEHPGPGLGPSGFVGHDITWVGDIGRAWRTTDFQAAQTKAAYYNKRHDQVYATVVIAENDWYAPLPEEDPNTQRIVESLDHIWKHGASHIVEGWDEEKMWYEAEKLIDYKEMLDRTDGIEAGDYDKLKTGATVLLEALVSKRRGRR